MGTLDLVLLGIVAAFAVFGLFRGLSGELGSLLGFAAALAAGYFLYGAAQGCAVTFGFEARGLGGVASAVIDGIFALVAFGLVRWGVSRFVKFCLGRVTDKLLGVLAGALKGGVAACAIMGVLPKLGVDVQNSSTDGVGSFFSESPISRMASSCVDAYLSGARGE